MSEKGIGCSCVIICATNHYVRELSVVFLKVKVPTFHMIQGGLPQPIPP